MNSKMFQFVLIVVIFFAFIMGTLALLEYSFESKIDDLEDNNRPDQGSATPWPVPPQPDSTPATPTAEVDPTPLTPTRTPTSYSEDSKPSTTPTPSTTLTPTTPSVAYQTFSARDALATILAIRSAQPVDDVPIPSDDDISRASIPAAPSNPVVPTVVPGQPVVTTQAVHTATPVPISTDNPTTAVVSIEPTIPTQVTQTQIAATISTSTLVPSSATPTPTTPLTATSVTMTATSITVTSTAIDVSPQPTDNKDKIDICHNGNDLSLPPSAVYGEQGHLYEDGQPRPGHANDYLGKCNPDPPQN